MVLLDIVMPGMPGLEVLKEIVSFDSSICVIMLTAIQNQAMVREAMELGAFDYITKPFDLSYINRIVAERFAFESPTPSE